MIKFLPKYQLSVEVAGGQFVTVELPYTCDFEVSRNSLASANTGTFRLYNLSRESRNLIQFDQYNVTQFRALQFRAGYGTFTPRIFNGTVRKAYSWRQGVDVITQIEGYDGGFQMVNGFTSMTVGSGQAAVDVIRSLAATLPGIGGFPIIGNYPAINLRGEVLFGQTWKILQQLTSGAANIDNNQFKALQDNEAIEGPLPEIDSETGLLGSPKRSDALIEIELLFEPRLTVGQVIDLKSTTNQIYNGRYKVMGFSHRGTISPSASGERRTNASLWLGTQVLQVISGTPL